MSSLLLSYSAVLFLFLSFGKVLIQEASGLSFYHTRITLRNVGNTSVSLVDYALTVHTHGDEGDIQYLYPISGAVVQPTDPYSICHPKHTEPCDAYWSGSKFEDDDVIELSKDGVAVDSVKAGQRKADVDSTNLEVSGLILQETENSHHWAETDKDRMMSDIVDAEFNREDVFDDSCWSIRSTLSSFPLDSCEVPISRDTITVGTFNTLFLFDGIRDRVSVWTTASEADEHLRRIADVVRQHHPDILQLAEVENLDMLKRLVAAVENPVYVPNFIQGKDTYTGQDVALITQGDWVKSLTRTNCRSSEVPGSSCGASLSRTIGVSKNLVALFDSCLLGFKFAIIGVHFYAFPTSKRPCIQRESQARVIQDVVTQLIEAGFEVMVMGDLNDYSDRYKDVLGSVSPTSRVLSMMRDPDGDGEEELDNVMRLLPADERYTAWWDRDGDDEYRGINESTQIDHILMTEKLFGRIQSVWIDHSLDPEVVSDHWPFFVRLETGTPTT